MSIRIAILDDHQIVIDGLKLLLSREADFDIVLEDTNGFNLLERLPHHAIDMVLTDIMMPIMDGYEFSKQVKAGFPGIKMVTLSMNGEGDLAKKLIEEVKVDGYLLKTANREELIQAIRTIYNGGTYYSEEVLNEWKAYESMLKQNEEIHLTHREIEIIQCMAKDLTNKQIADSLFISERTVETHRKNIFRKTNTHTPMTLVEFAKKRKLI